MKYFFDFANEIDLILKNPSNLSLKNAKILFSEEGIEMYFIRQLSSGKYNDDWYNLLYENNYFEYSKDKLNKYYFRWLDYLFYISRKYSHKENSEVYDKLLNIINKLTLIFRSNPKVNPYNFYLTVQIILNLPADLINKEHLEFINFALELESSSSFSLISVAIEKDGMNKFMKNENEDISLIFMNTIIFEFKRKDLNESERKVKPLINNYNLDNILNNNIDRLFDKYGHKIFSIAMYKIYEIVKNDPSKFNVITIPTIENSTQRWNFKDYEELILDFARNIFLKLDIDSIKFNIDICLNIDHPIIRRMVVYIIDKKYDELKSFFWEKYELFLEEIELRHEVYLLLKHNVLNFSDEEVQKIIYWIKTYNFVNDKEKEIYTDNEVLTIQALRRRKILYSLCESTNENVNNYLMELKQISDAEIRNPEYNFYHEIAFTDSSEKAPMAIEELDKMNFFEIKEYIINFKESNEYNSPTFIGLANLLSNSISQTPKKYLENIGIFIEIHPIYLNAVFIGFTKSQSFLKEINIIKFWDFILSVNNPFFKTSIGNLTIS